MYIVTRTLAAGLTFATILIIVALSIRYGYHWADQKWEKREQERTTAIEAERWEQARRMDKVQAEVEVLRARPEKVRTITEKVIEYVQADTDCASLPASYRSLWNADPDHGEATDAAALGNGGVHRLADAAR